MASDRVDEGAAGRKPALATFDMSLELALLERDAMMLLRRRAMEELLAEVAASLAMTPGLGEDAWSEWLRQLRNEAANTPSPSCFMLLAANRFKTRSGPSS